MNNDDNLYLNQYNLFETVDGLTGEEVLKVDEYAKLIILERDNNKNKVKDVIVTKYLFNK